MIGTNFRERFNEICYEIEHPKTLLLFLFLYKYFLDRTRKVNYFKIITALIGSRCISTVP